jgi:hypothetical protein
MNAQEPIRIGDFVQIVSQGEGLMGHTGEVVMVDNLKAVAMVEVKKRQKHLGTRWFRITSLNHAVRPVVIPAPRVCRCCGTVLS